jgi:hypothetical protein
MAATIPSSFSDKDIEQIKKEAFTTCAFCAARLPEKELLEYELVIKEIGQEYESHGWYVCKKCVNSERNRIQTKVVHTWMLMKARKERPCCGGGGGS